ncbi:ParB/RepB/Spo0J family partition protein [Vibrio sp. S11_S32]|uniref:ParB/RepB/Spo0J family partition protein n=1 Tax=Vibrio sp. S11_S32 TaxID=2720225 RepID=UPI0016801DD1|nr:ParB/RepB/Spo0J family partition protein [Vibrio sp. S11_S32]MBD1577858.1 ParB/RepB/Spo0J family partition protein [Vibrio sp. S11_S32]
MAGFIKKATAAARVSIEKKEHDRPAVMPVNRIEVEDEVLLIPHDMIHPDPNQPRKERDPVEFLKVKNSIKQTNGNTQPVEVRKHPDRPGDFMLVFGQGRWQACAELDLKVRAILTKAYDDEQKRLNPNVDFDRKFAQVSENVGRNDLPMVRQAESLAELVKLHVKDISVKGVGDMLGYSKSQASRLMKLASAPEDVKQLSIDGISQNINFLILMTDLHQLVDAKTFQKHLAAARNKELFERGLREIIKSIKAPKVTQHESKPQVKDKCNQGKTDSDQDKSTSNSDSVASSQSDAEPHYFPEMESCEVMDGYLLIYVKGYNLPVKIPRRQAQDELATAIECM